jgi:gliding motility-associated lipoprotein GldD
MDRFVGLLFVLLIPVMVFLPACGNGDPDNPKPRIFPRVDYPERAYTGFEMEACPFVFEYPTYADIDKDKRFFGEDPIHPCWFDIVFEHFDARLYMSYYPIESRADYDKFVTDAYKIANQINKRSDFMDEFVVSRGNVGGIILEFEGHAASPMHFYLTDTTNHFLRGALYFNTSVRPDSLAPVIEFLKVDVAHAIGTFEWK